jgi:serine/threonine protein phosphatase PrpC
VGIICSGATDIGMKRSSNQDSICLYPERSFYVVADGMGGHNGGDIASQLVVAELPKILEANIDLEASELLVKCIKDTNNLVYQKGQENPELKGMGTTVVVKYFKGKNLYIGNVGDSRAYLVNDKKLYQLSKDHSLVQEKINMGLYSREQAAFDTQKNVIIKTVGFEKDTEPDVFSYKVAKNDIFLICSDGLSGFVSDADIAHLVNKFIDDPQLATEKALDELVAALITQANSNGGKDNISVIISVAQ